MIMGTFRGFDKDDLEFFEKIPDKNQAGYYQDNKEQAKHIDAEFISLFKDIDIFLKIEFNSNYKWDAKRLSQGFGRDFDSIWGAWHSDKRKRQEDIQLFMNFGLFDDEQIPMFNVGMALRNITDEKVYEIYRNNLKSISDKMKKVLENSKNKYNFIDDEDKVISGNMLDTFSQWVELPGSIWVSFDTKTILDATSFIEKIKSVMRELYPIFDLLIKKEDETMQ